MVGRKYPVSTQVFKELYPFGPTKPDDPKSWTQHVRDNLFQEARIETFTYYGQERGWEVKFPGLDYTYGPHIRRLYRFPYHRQLFHVIDKLALTNWEIYELCNWECTLWHKDKYLRDHPNVKHMGDTTGTDVPTWDEIQSHEEELAADLLEATIAENEARNQEMEDDDESDKDDMDMEDDDSGGTTIGSEVAIERQGEDTDESLIFRFSL